MENNADVLSRSTQLYPTADPSHVPLSPPEPAPVKSGLQATAFGGFGLDRRGLGGSSGHHEMCRGLSPDFGVAIVPPRRLKFLDFRQHAAEYFEPEVFLVT